MVVCTFFQKGLCRYGQTCRFKHEYASKYSYNANAAFQGSEDNLTDKQLVYQVQTDVQAALKGGQWILSVYAPFKERPAFPGFADLSPDEARLFIYEAKANNNIDQAINYVNTLLRDAKSKYEQLLRPNAAIIKTIRRLYNNESPSSPFSSSSPVTNQTNASSVFWNAVQSSGSVFHQNPTPNTIFGPQKQNTDTFDTTNSTAKSIFSQANQNIFNSSQNQQPSNNASSIFASASQTIFGPQMVQDPFKQNNAPFSSQPAGFPPNNTFQSQNQNPFTQNNILAQQASSSSSHIEDVNQSRADTFFEQANREATNIFKQANTNSPSNIFAQANATSFAPQTSNVFQQNSVDDSGVYSKLEDLTQDDIDCFNSDDFTLGFIPEVPPPHSLCVK